MFRRLVFAALLTVAAYPLTSYAQQDTPVRERTWSPAQVQSWADRLGAQPLTGAIADCPDVTNRRDAILNGNRITTQIFNFGSISAPGNTITDIVWNGLGYGYEFGPFVAAEVVDEYRTEGRPRNANSVVKRNAAGNAVLDAQGDTVWVMHIVSDGLVSGGEVSPDASAYWGWQPIPCAQAVGTFEGLEVVHPESNRIPTSDAPDADLDGRPDSWPEAWYNEDLERYVWPGALRQGASNSDKEAIYFMNDQANCEFPYDPFPSDPDRNCGLGLEVETRMYQWANPLAEDAIFLIYKITNKSERDLEGVTFGMWGDPHIGGPNDWQDDLAFFDRRRNMVFAFDADDRSDVAGRVPGYFGYKFLESPGIGNEIIDGVNYPGDGIDNDRDGMVDESWTDGIDNDGDWDPETDDVGVDGIPGTGDEGEGDGLPTAGDPFDITRPGEPRFEFTDIDESDMIGLTSFASPPFAGNSISNDERVWDFVRPGRFDQVPAEPGDYVFLYGAGRFTLRAGETKRFSIALILGETLEDLTLNGDMVQQIYNAGYVFARPPETPVVGAVPGDRKVTLYWDDGAERSVDPLSREQDFEGYVIYRSTDPEFSDIQTITDINGSKFLFEPLRNRTGVEAKFDLANGLTGPSDIPYPRRGVAYDLGDDTGLFHTYVDSNNVINGQTYYYAVVAYDRGFTGGQEAGFADGIPPSETNKTITYNPTTDEYFFDENTIAVTPRAPVAGYVPPSIQAAGGIVHEAGTGTGDVRIDIVDPMAVPEGGRYRLDFDTVDGEVVYSVIDTQPKTVQVSANPGKFTSLGYNRIVQESFALRTADGTTLTSGTDYVLNPETGAVQVLTGEVGDALTATFQYTPLYRSDRLANEEANIVFDGLHMFVEDEPLGIDAEATGWAQGGGGAAYEVRVATAGPGRIPQPYDYEITFADQPVSEGFNTGLPLPFRIVNVTRANEPVQAFVPDVNRNGQWDVGEQIIFVETFDGEPTATWEVRFAEDAPMPGAGDVFYVETDKPFSAGDAFTFGTAGATADAVLASESMRDIYVVPNPYVATNQLEPRNPIARDERGERRLYFAGLPQRATIRIYSLAGELVDVLEHDAPVDNGSLFWDLRSKDNMNIAYGLYLYHVESEEGTFIGKFAIIK